MGFDCESNEAIFVAGHTVLIGSAMIRYLRNIRFENLILKSHAELDLADAFLVDNFLGSAPLRTLL
jgi:GDP-L-fucose synthase